MGQSGKPVSQVAQEMGLTESALRKWVKQARIGRSGGTEGSLPAEWIEVFYHWQRLHSTLGCLSPVQFKDHYWLSLEGLKVA